MSLNVTFLADGASTEISSFNVYKSILGTVTAVEPFDLVGKYFVFRAGGDAKFTKFSFTSSDIEQVAAQINQYSGIKASVSGVSPNRRIIIRGTNDVLEIVKTVGSEAMSIVPGVFIGKQNFVIIGSVPFVPATESYTFIDGDGDKNDYYRVSTIDTSLDEQPPGTPFKVKLSVVPTCNVSGLVVTSDGGEALIGAEVIAKPWLENSSELNYVPSQDLVKTYTDEKGRWMMTLPQKIRYYLEIPQANWSNAFVVPEQSELLFESILVDATWRHDDRPLAANFGSGNV